MEVNRCLNCMEEIEDAVCPKCGYNHYKVYEQSPMALKVNTVLYGRYLVGRMLGQGGFGMTYIGFDLLLNIKVAIKEYFPMGSVSRDNTISNLLQWNLSKDQEEQWREGCENFLKEARKMAKLDSISGIVRVRDTFYENQTAYIIMDYIEGITLKKYLESNGTMDYINCINMLSPMMSSLNKVHEHGLIHRDISPDNMMVMGDGSLMLLDLGAAKDVSTGREGMSQLVTKKGFSPAEQYMESGSVGPWTDVYAFCATMYYCMYGRLIPEAMERLMDDNLAFPPLPNGTELPDDIKETLRAGMAVHPENRIQTMGELIGRMAPYIASPTQDVYTSMQMYGASLHTDKKNNKKNKKDKKKLAKILIPVFSVMLVAVISVLLFLFRPWEPKIKMLGNTNSNILNDGGFAIKDKEYEYYLDHNNNISVCKYDESAGHFYLDTATIVAENAMYINIGKNKVYFLQDDGTGNIKLCDMDFDGSNVSVIQDGLKTSMLLQYALLSNGDEYLYFITLNDDETSTVLKRYDIKKKKTEIVINDDLCWYNLYKDSIYYTTFTDDNKMNLKKSNLKGKHEKILDKDNYYSYGFIENDKIFLYSITEGAMCVLDLKGKQQKVFYDAKMDINNFTFAYGDGWIYYVNSDDSSIYHIREDGTANSELFGGRYIISICYAMDNLWLQEGTYDADGNLKLLRSYVCYKDGSSVIVLDDADVMTTDDGLLYRQDGSTLVICGYVGDSYIVEIPYEIDGVPVYDIDTDQLPQGHEYYLSADESDFKYNTSTDGNGIVITKYTGSMTKFIIPNELDGKPVVEIGEGAFENSDVADIVISENIKIIGNNAFNECSDLTKVYFKEGLEEIGEYAFGSTGLTEVEFPESLTSIEHGSFYDTDITEVFIPKNVVHILNTSFAMSPVKNINVDPDNTIITSEDGVVYSKDKKSLILVPDGKEGSFVIPAYVEELGSGSFLYCNGITEVSVEPGSKLQKVGLTFVGCDSLEKIDFSNGGTDFESGVIYQCYNVKELYFSPDVTVIPSEFFYENDFPSTLSKVSYGSGCDCQTQWPEGVEVIIADE